MNMKKSTILASEGNKASTLLILAGSGQSRWIVDRSHTKEKAS